MGLDICSINLHFPSTHESVKRMILTCPECATRFKINPEALGTNGRTVRCSQCKTTWFVAAEPDALDLIETETKNELVREEPREEDSAQPGKVKADAPQNTPRPAPSVPEVDSVKADEMPPAPHTMIRERTDRQRARRRLIGVGMIWGVTLGLLALMALAAILFRTQIVEKFPGAAPVYRAFGLEANVLGLDFYDIQTKFGNNDGTPVLIVNGRIKNLDTSARDVGMVRLSFKNKAGERIASWVIEPPKARLAPGETVKFATQYPNPPVDGATLIQEFVDETQVSGGEATQKPEN